MCYSKFVMAEVLTQTCPKCKTLERTPLALSIV
jgi:hypothetical protein